MINPLHIRPGLARDAAAIERLYREVFPDEDLVPLVNGLMAEPSGVVSLVCEMNGAVIGHVAFSRCRVTGSSAEVALLGPLAVAPAMQRRGVGRALVRDGVKRLEGEGVARVLVLGDPGYYSRLGFVTERAVVPPYTLVQEWREAWQSLPLGPANVHLEGRLSPPEPWLRPRLWSP